MFRCKVSILAHALTLLCSGTPQWSRLLCSCKPMGGALLPGPAVPIKVMASTPPKHTWRGRQQCWPAPSGGRWPQGSSCQLAWAGTASSWVKWGIAASPLPSWLSPGRAAASVCYFRLWHGLEAHSVSPGGLIWHMSNTIWFFWHCYDASSSCTLAFTVNRALVSFWIHSKGRGYNLTLPSCATDSTRGWPEVAKDVLGFVCSVLYHITQVSLTGDVLWLRHQKDKIKCLPWCLSGFLRGWRSRGASPGRGSEGAHTCAYVWVETGSSSHCKSSIPNTCGTERIPFYG